MFGAFNNLAWVFNMAEVTHATMLDMLIQFTRFATETLALLKSQNPKPKQINLLTHTSRSQKIVTKHIEYGWAKKKRTKLYALSLCKCEMSTKKNTKQKTKCCELLPKKQILKHLSHRHMVWHFCELQRDHIKNITSRFSLGRWTKVDGI